MAIPAQACAAAAPPGALRDHGISVILISQGSSEHSICFAIPEAEAARAETVVRQAFDRELREAQIQSVDVDPGCSILAVVGDGHAVVVLADSVWLGLAVGLATGLVWAAFTLGRRRDA